MNERILIIAEAGVNHNGDLTLAKQLIDAASEAGADLVKFQTFSAERLAIRAAEKAEYQKQSSDNDESQYQMLKRLELSADMHQELIAHCVMRNIRFYQRVLILAVSIFWKVLELMFSRFHLERLQICLIFDILVDWVSQ